MQLGNSSPNECMEKITDTNGCVTNSLLLNYQVIRKNNLLTLEKLNSRATYNIIINAIPHRPTSKSYFEQRFTIVIKNGKIVWKIVWIEYYLRLNLSSRY